MPDITVVGNEVILIVEMLDINTFVVRKENIPTYVSNEQSLSMYSDVSYYTLISGKIGKEDITEFAEKELLKKVGVSNQFINEIEILQKNIPLYKDTNTRVNIVYITLNKPKVNIPLDIMVKIEDLTDSVLIGLEEWGEIIMSGRNYDIPFLLGYLVVKEKKR